jgi:hypothetical protein
VSEIDPVEVSQPSRRVPAERFSEEPAEFAAPGLKKPEREGLPSNYRMRADAHYVDQLTSRRNDRLEPRSAEQRSSERGEPRGDRADVRDRRADRALAQLAEDMSGIEAAANLLAGETAPIVRRAGLDLIRAQAWRASWLVRANAILDGTHRVQMRPRPLGAILWAIRDGFAAECRLNGFAVHVRTADWNQNVVVDETALTAGIIGAVLATAGLTNGAEGVVVTIDIDAAGGEIKLVDVAQEAVTVPSVAGQRFLDASWTDRPGGWTAVVGALVARTAAQLHGGDLTFSSGERRGSTIRLALSRAN